MPNLFETSLPGASAGATSVSGVTVTASGTAHTKGSWVELISSTSADAYYISIATANATATSGSDTSTLLDIGTGAASSETVVIPNIPIGHSKHWVGSNSGFNTPLTLPLYVASGTRIAARIQSAVVSKTADVMVEVREVSGTAPSDWPNKTTAWAHLGINTATSNASTAPGTSWTEIVASTANAYQQIVGVAHGDTTTTYANTTGLMEFGSGGSGSEVLQYGYGTTSSSVEEFNGVNPPESFFAMYWPWAETSGTRLVARLSTGPFRASFLVAQ